MRAKYARTRRPSSAAGLAVLSAYTRQRDNLKVAFQPSMRISRRRRCRPRQRRAAERMAPGGRQRRRRNCAIEGLKAHFGTCPRPVYPAPHGHAGR